MQPASLRFWTMLVLCIKTINAFPDDFYCASGFYEKSKAATAF